MHGWMMEDRNGAYGKRLSEKIDRGGCLISETPRAETSAKMTTSWKGKANWTKE